MWDRRQSESLSLMAVKALEPHCASNPTASVKTDVSTSHEVLHIETHERTLSKRKRLTNNQYE